MPDGRDCSLVRRKREKLAFAASGVDVTFPQEGKVCGGMAQFKQDACLDDG